MIELLLGAVAISAMAKLADADGQSAFVWGLVTFVIVAVCIAMIPLPLLRVLIAFVLTLVVMMIRKGMTMNR